MCPNISLSGLQRSLRETPSGSVLASRVSLSRSLFRRLQPLKASAQLPYTRDSGKLPAMLGLAPRVHLQLKLHRRADALHEFGGVREVGDDVRTKLGSESNGRLLRATHEAEAVGSPWCLPLLTLAAVDVAAL